MKDEPQLSAMDSQDNNPDSSASESSNLAAENDETLEDLAPQNEPRPRPKRKRKPNRNVQPSPQQAESAVTSDDNHSDHDDDDEELEGQDGNASYNAAPRGQSPAQEKSRLTVTVSAALKSRLARQAYEEGLSLEEFISELLAEGAVLRAWEIVEKKAQMRGGNVQQPQGQGRPQQGRNGNHRQNRDPNKGGGGAGGGGGRRNTMNHQRYTNIMDDKAAFLEYVRSQERKQGR